MSCDEAVDKWKQYPAYKDSGVEWIGAVPEGWKVKPLKFIARIETGNTPSRADERNYKNGVIPWVKPDDLGSFVPIIDSKDKLTEFGISFARFVPKGSALVCCIGTVGKVGIAGCDLTTNQQINAVIFDYPDFQMRYGQYALIASKSEYEKIANTVVVSIINKTSQSGISYPIPHPPEQHAIADFLDRETGRIDILIEKKERQIELLQEKRAALISHAVTKGLDPDVKMKDSGMEWLGEIPVHWDETIASALFMDNKKKNKDTKEKNLLSLSYGNIIRKNINTNEGLLPETFEAYQIVYPGYIVLRLTDLQNDKRSLRVGHVNEKGIITSAYTGLRKKSGAVECSKYFYYLLHTYDLIKVFYGMGAGVRQSLNFNELRKLRLLLPPPEEQKAIVSFIDYEKGYIDTLTTKVHESIYKLREYRTALISAAVTGKIDVRGEET